MKRETGNGKCVKLKIWISILLFFAFTVFRFPSYAAGWKSLARKGTSEYKQGKYQDALANFTEAGKKNPENSTVHFNTGCAAYKLNDLDGALGSFQKSSALEKESRSASENYYNIGNAFFQKGEKDKAIEAYKKALLLNPKDDQARHNLAIALRANQSKDNQQQGTGGGKGEKDKDNPEKDKSQQPKPQVGEQETEALLQTFEEEERKQAQKMKKKRQQQDPTVEEDW